jgi:hypothetical protein
MTTQDKIQLTVRAALIMRSASGLVDCGNQTIAQLTLQELQNMITEAREAVRKMQP